MEKSKHYFSGINSNEGFCNHFDNINNAPDGHIFILKGGPGTGKSTLMKTIGSHFEKMGQMIEYYHCSSDPDSLDGIYIPDKKISIVDGTAPHVCEAKLPKIREEIINLGDFIKPQITKYHTNISSLLKQKDIHFTLAYQYLKSAGILYNTNENLTYNLTKTDTHKEIISHLELQQSKEYTEKFLFLSAVDADGIVNLSNINTYHQFVTLSMSQASNHQVLMKLHEELKKRGVSHYVFGEILNTNLINSIYILDDDILIKNESQSHIQEVSRNEYTIKKLTLQAGKHIARARKYHKKVEKYYIKNMDFEGINKITQSLINTINKA